MFSFSRPSCQRPRRLIREYSLTQAPTTWLTLKRDPPYLATRIFTATVFGQLTLVGLLLYIFSEVVVQCDVILVFGIHNLYIRLLACFWRTLFDISVDIRLLVAL
jgi:hypothetical protein